MIPNKPTISVFFPVFKDERTVRTVTEKAIRICREVASDFEVVIIDDCSPDRAGAIADELAAEHQCVRVIHHPSNLGYGAAVRSGFGAAQHEWVCFTDGDDEYDISDLRRLIRLRDFYDLIITFRYKKIYSTKRILISYVYNMLLRWMFRTPYRDISTGLRLMRRDVLADLHLTTTSPFIGAELTVKAMLKGYRIGEVGIQTFPRKFGQGSSTSLRNIWKTLVDMRRVHREIFSDNYDMPRDRGRD